MPESRLDELPIWVRALILDLKNDVDLARELGRKEGYEQAIREVKAAIDKQTVYAMA